MMIKQIKNQKIWWLIIGLLAASFMLRKKPAKEKDILFIEPNPEQKLFNG